MTHQPSVTCYLSPVTHPRYNSMTPGSAFMSENILVVEYEPRYTDRVRQALAGQPFTPLFAKDGDEALRALDSAAPRLIVLSSVIPKISTADLVRAIRE